MKIYKIIVRNTSDELAGVVNGMINAGYMLAGGAQYATDNGQDVYMQSVVIDNKTQTIIIKKDDDEKSTGKQNDGLPAEIKTAGKRKRGKGNKS